ncbi:hypothetical protein ACFPRL_24295 [Pseudoclavibacter helvolus]
MANSNFLTTGACRGRGTQPLGTDERGCSCEPTADLLATCTSTEPQTLSRSTISALRPVLPSAIR